MPEVDLLVALAQAEPAVYGARLTGGGFGGSIVALVREGEAAAVAGACRQRIRSPVAAHGTVLVPDRRFVLPSSCSCVLRQFRLLFVLPSASHACAGAGKQQPELLPADGPGTAAIAVTRKPTGAAREQALTAALERFGAIRTTPRADTPDGWVTAVRTIPAAEARHAPWPDLIDPRLRGALEARGISQLYVHQAAALELALTGRSVVVITPTASGKTLCYNAPVLNTALADPASRALYLFPDESPRAGSARRASRADRAW